jgi:tRNA pseudouridine38-40 synthase
MNALDEPAALRRARLVIAYDGAPFHGFAEARDQRTVAGDLRAALERVLQRPVELVGAGRTDAGVHGWGQVVSVDLPVTVDLEALARRLTALCAPSIVVRAVEWCADPEFSARFSASWRQYRYHVWNAPTPVPALAATSWHVVAPLQLWAMQLACDPLIGEHDFASFCRRPKVEPGAPVPSLRRRVLSAEWHQVPSEWGDGLLRFEIRANAFCHQMVRSIVGTLVDVGLGRLTAGELTAVLARRDRAAAGQVAPPHGLVLWDVGYPT